MKRIGYHEFVFLFLFFGLNEKGLDRYEMREHSENRVFFYGKYLLNYFPLIFK